MWILREYRDIAPAKNISQDGVVSLLYNSLESHASSATQVLHSKLIQHSQSQKKKPKIDHDMAEAQDGHGNPLNTVPEETPPHMHVENLASGEPRSEDSRNFGKMLKQLENKSHTQTEF